MMKDPDWIEEAERILGAEWYRRIARMTREELVDTLEEEAVIRARVTSKLLDAQEQAQQEAANTQRKLNKLKDDTERRIKEERERPLYFICSARRHAEYGIRRMGRDPNREHILNTNDMSWINKLVGRNYTADDFRLVRDWRKGRYTHEVEDYLRLRSVAIGSIGYAPDAHYDMVDDGSYADRIIREHEYHRAPPTLRPDDEFRVGYGDHSAGPYRVSQVSVSHGREGSEVQVSGQDLTRHLNWRMVQP